MPDSSYHPVPLDASKVELPLDLTSLTEQLSSSIHDLWAIERMAQGWKFGSERNDALKEHPCLIAYDELPESEKEFDRKTVTGTLKAILSLGYQIKSPGSTMTPGRVEGLAAWQSHLEKEAVSAKSKGPRAWTFDMDDENEVTLLKDTGLDQARAALAAVQEHVFPAWKAEDADALRLQRWHARIASLAIWPGIFAIVFAILQLSVGLLEAEHWISVKLLAGLETGSVIIATLAIFAGFYFHLHHNWLAHRQRAERLRSLKFHALSWPELWCDFEAWKKRLINKIAELRSLTLARAHDWARERDDVRPDLPKAPHCSVPMADLQALSMHYRIKRLEFQRHYFEHQSAKAHRTSWFTDRKFGLIIFGLSVVIVLVHGIFSLYHQGDHGSANSAGDHSVLSLEIIMVSLAAILPVIGFGFRAWFAAFEAPRSRNLYRAKALALVDYIARSTASSSNVEQTLHHIAHGEHFFTNEHREWCRLQMEAEWFV